jgi:ankyrin repeat protein
MKKISGKKDAPRTVTIRDAGLRKGLEQSLRKGAVKGMQVDRGALASQHEIDWSEDTAEAFPNRWTSIAALDGLEHATSLRKLSVWGNAIRSLTPLATLTELDELWAFQNQIKTTAGLENKPKLRVLHLDDNPLETIGELRGLPALEELGLRGTKVADLSPLLELPKLRKLSVLNLEKARTEKNLRVLVALAQRKVVMDMDRELQRAFERQEAAALASTPSEDVMVERLRALGQLELAQLWRKGGPAAKDDDWNTLLHRVVSLSDNELAKGKGKGKGDALRVDLIKELARAGVAVDAQNDETEHHTALSLAIASGRSPAVIQALLDAGASVRLPRRDPALAVALEQSAPSAVIAKLLAAGADVTHPRVLGRAAEKGAVELVAPAARKIDWRTQLHRTTPALALAVGNGRDRMVDLLLGAGAPAAAGTGYPAVFYASSVAMLDKLIAHGADPLVRTNYGTALHRLRRNSPQAAALIDRLVDLGVPADARDYHGRTALYEVTEEAHELVKGKWAIKPSVLAVAKKLVARGADPNARLWSPEVARWPEAWTLLDAKHGGEIIGELGGVTTAVWARRQLKIVAGAKSLEGEALEALTELALAGLLKKLGADEARVTKQVSAMLRARKDAVSKALAPLGLHPLVVLWLARGAQGRDLFERGMLQIAVDHAFDLDKGPAKTHALLRALCDQGAPVELVDPKGSGALDRYVSAARTYKFAPDVSLVRALLPKSPKLITGALIELLAGMEPPVPAEMNAVLDVLVGAGADLIEPKAFAVLCRSRRPELVRRALAAGADPAWDGSADDCALEQALRADDVQAVEILLDAGTPPDIGREGTGPAFHETLSAEALTQLQRHGLDVSLRGGYKKETLLDRAVERAVNLLDHWDGHDWSGVGRDAAVRDAAARFVAHLVASGWSLDTVDPDGRTPRDRLQSIGSKLGRAVLAKANLTVAAR